MFGSTYQLICFKMAQQFWYNFNGKIFFYTKYDFFCTFTHLLTSLLTYLIKQIDHLGKS